jgi:hypothetical protein
MLLSDGSTCAATQRRLKDEAYALYKELETQLLMQLRFQSWPPDIASKYARAYARHGHEHQLIPPPPEGCTIPMSFFHMFETAAAAAKVMQGSSAKVSSEMLAEMDAKRDAEMREENSKKFGMSVVLMVGGAVVESQRLNSTCL